jgi:hypothetical protein
MDPGGFTFRQGHSSKFPRPSERAFRLHEANIATNGLCRLSSRILLTSAPTPDADSLGGADEVVLVVLDSRRAQEMVVLVAQMVVLSMDDER